MRFLIPLFLLSFEVVFAQGFSFAFPDPLKKYLELTDPQVAEIVTKNERLGRFRSEKMQRQSMVQFEIAQETGRSTLDPMAIGVRYLELETIRRELETEVNKMVAEIQGLLTLAQKARLASLEEVLRQHNTACSALSWNLMSEPSVPGDFASFLLQQSPVGCGNQFRVGVCLTGFISVAEPPR